MTAPKTLLLLAHPTIDQARLNRVLIDAVSDVSGLEIRDLYTLYPDFKIDVAAEQSALRSADLVIFQFPFYWYSTPALLKEWQDEVLTWGFAFGRAGEALRGKKLFASVTAGSAEETYVSNGSTQFSMEELLRPLRLTAQYCGMEYREAFAIYGGARITPEEQLEHGKNYRAKIMREIQELGRGSKLP